MENWNVPASASDAGANKKMEHKQCLNGTCLFACSCHHTVTSNVTETIDIIGNVGKNSDETEKKMPDTNSPVFELSFMIDSLPPVPHQSDQRILEEEIKLNTEAEEELNDAEDEEHHEDDAIDDRSSVSSVSVSTDTDSDEELDEEEVHLLPCRYTDKNCPFAECNVHKELCDICHKYCLVPGDSEEQRSHAIQCTKVHIAESQYAKELQQSYDKMCNICIELVLNKRTREQRFGILPKCPHVFCIKCIRNWRKAEGIPINIRNGCPVCRKISNFVCPSFVWVEKYAAKAKLITDFKKGCKKITCKHFQPGKNVCPFGSRCFYRHAAT